MQALQNRDFQLSNKLEDVLRLVYTEFVLNLSEINIDKYSDKWSTMVALDPILE